METNRIKWLIGLTTDTVSTMTIEEFIKAHDIDTSVWNVTQDEETRLFRIEHLETGKHLSIFIPDTAIPDKEIMALALQTILEDNPSPSTLSEIEQAIFAHLTDEWQTGGQIVRACRWDIPEADILQVATVLLNVSVIRGIIEHKDEGGIVYYRLPQEG